MIGSQGADAVAASGVGNVTRFVLRGASCPVLVIGRNGLAAGPPGSARRRPKVLALPHGGQARLPTPPPAPPAAVHAARLAAVGE